MGPTNIKEFRTLVRGTLESKGFAPKKLASKMPVAWALPGNEVIPIFFPHEIRRPWGFNLSGTIGIQLQPLSTWLTRRLAPEGHGIFQFFFVSYHIANDEVFRRFQVEHGQEAPVEEWIDRIKQQLLELPITVDGLINTYRRTPDDLGWVSSRINKPAWDFLLRWYADPDAELSVPLGLF